MAAANSIGVKRQEMLHKAGVEFLHSANHFMATKQDDSRHPPLHVPFFTSFAAMQLN